jgi:hypothetical protein
VLATSQQYVQLCHEVLRQATFNCSHTVLCVADSIDSPWSSVEGPAVEALHAMVSHDIYCQKLLESDTIDSYTFQDVLVALTPSAQLTFGACLARLATHHWDLAANRARGSSAKATESAPRGVEPGSRLLFQSTLFKICRHIKEAVLVGFPLHPSNVISAYYILVCACTAYLTSWVVLSTNVNCLLMGCVHAHPAALNSSAVITIPIDSCLHFKQL